MNRLLIIFGIMLILIGIIFVNVGKYLESQYQPPETSQDAVIVAADYQYFNIGGNYYFQFELDGMMCVEQVGYARSLSCVTHGN